MEDNQQQEQQQQPYQTPSPNILEEVKSFYTVDFKALFQTYFQHPFAGLLSIFQNPSGKTFLHSMILYVSCFVLYCLGAYILVGEYRQYMTIGAFLSIGLTPVLIMFSISGISFIIKSILGKADFKNELLTGALCGIPLALIIPLSLVAKLFGSGANVMMMVQNPLGLGMAMSLIMLYLLLLMINTFHQSLKANGVKEVLAWYLSPVSILLAMYIAISISGAMF